MRTLSRDALVRSLVDARLVARTRAGRACVPRICVAELDVDVLGHAFMIGAPLLTSGRVILPDGTFPLPED